MLYFLNLVCLSLSLLFLGKAAAVAIKHLTHIAHHLSWNTFVVAFLILGVATSIPEFLIGINSALDKMPQLSLGNLIGATIVLLTLVIGLSALISGKVKIDSNFSGKDLYITNFILLLPLALFHDNYFGRVDALVVLISYFAYIVKVYTDRHRLQNNTSHESNGTLLRHVATFLFAFGVVALASKMAVESAIVIAEGFNIPLLLMGILVFSIGTNFPEIAVSLSAIKKHDSSLVGGNILGSATTNSLIIAILGLIHPIKIIEADIFLVSVFFFTISVLVFSYFVKSKSEISRLEGFFLLSVYSFFIIFEVITKLI